MIVRPLVAVRVLSLLALFFAIAPQLHAISHKHKKHGHVKKRAAAPAVSPTRRVALVEQITDELHSSKVNIENPAALIPAFERLYRLSTSQGDDVVSVLQFGDSHTAADIWTGELRTLFQQKFGDAGAGFSHAGRPWNSYRREDLRSYASRRWYTDGLFGREGDGMYGLAGASSTTSRSGEWVSIDSKGSILEVWYLQQPGGGSLELTDNGAPLTTISTDGPAAAGYYKAERPTGDHNYKLETTSAAPVRLFGWVTGNPRGVTYEMLGINGAQASMILDWNPQVFADNVAHRAPALIVIAYGTNEAGNSHITEESYREILTAVVNKMRQAAPAASIMLIGPPDRAKRRRFHWEPYTAVDRIVAAERAVAASAGCAFYDLRGKMGGEGVMHKWTLAGLAQGDHVHFTGTGYKLIAGALFSDLMSQYEMFLKARTEPDTPVQQTSGETDKWTEEKK